uniref:Uncharacterized protein n=1 Tax=Stomoxys calcitrans TaxID=35570 RepID=A0A1I8PCS8_STOCA
MLRTPNVLFNHNTIPWAARQVPSMVALLPSWTLPRKAQ